MGIGRFSSAGEKVVSEMEWGKDWNRDVRGDGRVDGAMPKVGTAVDRS